MSINSIFDTDEFRLSFLRIKAANGQRRIGITGRADFGPVAKVPTDAIDFTEETAADRDMVRSIREFIRNRDRNAPARRNPADGIEQAVPGSDDLEDLE